MKEKLLKVLSLCLAIVMVLSMAACGSSSNSSSSSSSNVKDSTTSSSTETAKTKTVVDNNGNTVTVPTKIDRIVVCDILPLPSVLTTFFDSAEKIVGMAPASYSAAKNGIISELYPEILNAKTDFMEGTTVNIEELMKLNPDIVFYSASSKDLGEQLTKAGFSAVAISPSKWEYNSIETLNQWISLLGEIFPENEKGQIVSNYSNKIYNLVQERVKTVKAEDKRNAFFVFKYDESSLFTSGTKFFGQWWCDAIGVNNVAKEIETDNAAKVNLEQVYKWDPDLIFITNFTSVMDKDILSGSVFTNDWSAVKAVKNGSVYKMPLGIYRSYTPGADTPITLLWLAKQAYPELFKDINITEETIKYYKEVFGITITEAQANKIFASTSSAAAGF